MTGDFPDILRQQCSVFSGKNTIQMLINIIIILNICLNLIKIIGHPGVCPAVEAEEMAFGVCANTCEDDSSCSGTQKCCATACGGRSCMEALQIQPPITAVVHPGECPAVEAEEMAFGVCANTCEDDGSCSGTQKCCATACGGRSCMEAVQIQPPVVLGDYYNNRAFTLFSFLL